MSIKSQLVRLLAHLPKTQTVPERRALLMITGFDHLGAKIDSFEKSNLVFFSELIELIFSEGQAQSLEFLNELADSELLGLEARKKLNNLIAEIAVLDTQHCNSECVERKSHQTFRGFNSDYSQLTSQNFPKTYSKTNLEFLTQSQFPNQQENLPIFSTPSQSTEGLEEQQDTKLIIPSIPGTQAFEFTVVMVDIQGKEISRRRGQAHSLTEDIGNGVTLKMVYIPGGEFSMGSPETEGRRYSNERPQRSVTIKPFLISKYPITQAQWREVAALSEVGQELKLRPSRSGGKSHPVTQVSWHDAVEFCDRLSQTTGHEYRLPTEAEWEYACRAGTTTPFHFGETITSDLANYDGRYLYSSEPKGIYREKTNSVDTFQVANAFGLFELHGNVWEWCLDHWHESYDNAPITGEAWIDCSNNQTRLIRGGSWRNEPLLCRSASRWHNDVKQQSHNIGFRIIRSL
ncbi:MULTISPECIES: SUMF1/EgtB/PvdO family nonheme iron enzyme [Cyanophyceae]|uniref:SUMF1/EgtB/PvdO family nonheme iron enzyme n=1 Tax=Cyanophyceae TaxID=3028117 RepID=UPI001F54C7D6|nr:SUMF1/EgtB/PvdO family nonheme iron enzyme [Trichocoleus sp. FACHB-69]